MIRRKLTKAEIADILNDMVIIVDSREKKNQHILEYFFNNGINYNKDTMETADYTCVFPNYKNYNLDYKILIERKSALDELIGNFTKHRDRFQREFERIGNDQKCHMLLEGFTFTKILNGSYKSQFLPKSYMASLFTWSARYNSPVWFTTKDTSGEVIFYLLKYNYMEILKNIEIDVDSE